MKLALAFVGCLTLSTSLLSGAAAASEPIASEIGEPSKADGVIIESTTPELAARRTAPRAGDRSAAARPLAAPEAWWFGWHGVYATILQLLLR